ncbi:hypothetical protein EYF80_022152 [Liparis tanakae]|uniref:Uncharacterized protein n=1 Tax=Liparis tanakae TaxID=230148 RepID=A0A4Z2HPE9_9TELE|nr:hypothetical protein EYF80_022152 [Liparis tanakae]
MGPLLKPDVYLWFHDVENKANDDVITFALEMRKAWGRRAESARDEPATEVSRAENRFLRGVLISLQPRRLATGSGAERGGQTALARKHPHLRKSLSPCRPRESKWIDDHRMSW